MMTHEVRGVVHAPLAVPPPRIFRRREEESSGDSGDDLAQLSPPLTSDFGLDVHVFIASTVLCIGELRAALDLARQRGYEAAKFTTSA